MDPIKLENSHDVLCKEEIKQEISISVENIQIEIIKDEEYKEVQTEEENWMHEVPVHQQSQENVPKHEESCIIIKTEVADKLINKKPCRKPRKRAKQNKTPKEKKNAILYPRKCDHCTYEVPKKGDHYRHYIYMHSDILHEYPYGSVKVACSFCGCLISPTHLKNHELKHGEKTFKCSACPSAFHNKTKLTRHMNTVHSSNKLVCDYCSKGFKSREDITRHIRIHTGEKPFKCHVCAAGFAHSGNRSIHMRTAHQIMQYIPPQIKHEACTKREDYIPKKIEIEIGIPFQTYSTPKYSTENDIKLPKKYESTAQCKVCFKTIKEEDHKDLCSYCSKQKVKEEIILSEHFTDPSPEHSPKYSPHESQDPLSYYETYEHEIVPNEYIEIKMEELPYTQTCSFSTYTLPYGLHTQSPSKTKPTQRKIRQRRKNNNPKKVKSENNIQTDALSQEQSTVKKKRIRKKSVKAEQKGPRYPRKCDHCTYKIPKRSEHYRHYMFMHGDILHEYPYPVRKSVPCSFCGVLKAFNRIKEHELTHGEKTFKCEVCTKSFHNNVQLRKHIDSVHSEKRLICHYCSKPFKTREVIIRHLRVHTGEKPYKCHICNAGFAHSGNRTVHIRLAHENSQNDNKTNVKKRNKNIKIGPDGRLTTSYRKMQLTNADYSESIAEFADFFNLSESISHDSRLVLGETVSVQDDRA